MMVDDRQPVGGEGLGEFEIIARYFAPLATDAAALGLRDDAAVLVVAEGYELIATCDTLIEGVHFLPGDPPETIGYKSLAVNLSDLAAKGARGHAYLLSLAVPRKTPGAWFEAFAAGLGELQDAAKISLVGGDTTATPGPLTITITALGLVRHGHAVLRHGAKSGDRLYVSGTIGDAYLGLRLLEDPPLSRSWELTSEEHAFLVDRYRRPPPRMALVIPVRNFARGAIDVSDGLVADIDKLAQASHVGAAIEAGQVPFSPAAQKALRREPELLAALLTAGDDYEVVAAVPESSASAFEAEAKDKQVAVTPVGRLTGQSGEVRVLRPNGEALALDRKGYAHF
jgi:thiamine-monophosphate kinase